MQFLKSIDSFRYSRDYVLSGAPGYINDLQSLLSVRSDFGLIRFFADCYPNLKVSFDSDGELVSVGTVDRSDSPWRAIVDDQVMGALFDVVDSPEERALVRRAIEGEVFGVFPEDTEDGKSFKVSEFIQLFGAENIWTAISYSESEINAAVNEARLIVETQQRRKLIFSKK
ncbi:hypothetical protein AAHI06_08890 [Pseudomonas salmasensis]|uniref:hypothetical protein n=1 Tax=Pseudomonas salmasensis TaxID=2745514 RepID=UPI003219B7F6